MKYKAIIFDLDGTLVDSVEDLADAMNNTLKNKGLPEYNIQSYKLFIGNGIRNLVRLALPQNLRDEESIEKYYRLMLKEYKINCVNKTKVYPEIKETLEEIKLKGIKTGVLSNKADEFTKRIVDSLLPRFFDIINGLKSEELKKPNPYSALEIVKQLGALPEETIYIGDTDVDMETANNAGMTAVGALWGFRTREELLNSGAKFVLDRPSEISGLLK